MKKDTGTQLKIYEYSDYRKFLLDYYSSKKKNNPSYSHRLFARQAGLSSPSHLLMIINGTRNLSLKTTQKFAEGLSLSAKEKRYFELMVLYSQTDDLQMNADKPANVSKPTLRYVLRVDFITEVRYLLGIN